MHRTIITLHEYRMRYPDTAAIPTLTQSRLLEVLLDRQRYKAAKLARRRARWKSICTAPRNAFVTIWKALSTPALISSPSRASLAPRPQA
jgi:hypothetical protein